MENEKSRDLGSRDQSYRASLYFSAELNHAIKRGREFGMASALRKQEQNNATQALSNHLIARSFLVEQKLKLHALTNSLDEITSADEAATHTLGYIEQLESRLDEVFIAEDGDDELSKLSDDQFFREAISVPGIEGIVLARHLAKVDMSTLFPPEELLEHMANMVHAISIDLQTEADYLRNDAPHMTVFEYLKEEMFRQMTLIDEALANNLRPVVDKRGRH